MSNNWFQFKEFKIEQSLCAMKVSTDACVQGAWAVKKLLEYYPNDANIKILDIGCGTGLLSLMIIQTFFNARIDAIDMDENAYLQASHNFINSKWSDGLIVQHTSLQTFDADCLYDFIICNPPFFHNSLKNTFPPRTIARHDDTLSKEVLATNTIRLLDERGLFCVMYPTDEWKHWNTVAVQNRLYASNILDLHAKEHKPVKRKLGFFAKKIVETKREKLIVYDEQNQYTPLFKQLLASYYLDL